jgi:hypothetical protein
MASQDKYRLIIRRGPEPNKTFDLEKDVITLGRDITNDIVINDPELSRHHARFTRGAHGYNVEDLGSTNGTFISGQRISGVRPLNPGDMIGLGETVTLGYELLRGGQEAGPSAQTMPGSAAPPQQPAPQPYAPQQPAPQPQQPQQQGYPPQQQAPYDQQYEPQPEYPPQDQAPGYPQQPDYGYGGPQAPPGYDYDPYAIREEEPDMMRWLLIGCGVMVFFCCCCTIVGMVYIDQKELWYTWPFEDTITPIIEGIANALGFRF